MQRGSIDTPRWARRLAPFLAVSLGLHLSVLAIPLPTVTVESPVTFSDVIELGLENPTRAPATPPQSPTPPTLDDTPETPTPPRPAAPHPPRPPRVRAPRVTPPPPAPTLPDPPETQLHEPTLANTLEPTTVDAGLSLTEDSAVALTEDASTGEDSAVALLDDVADAMTVAEVDAAVDAGPQFLPIPAVASAAGDLATAIPAGSVVTLLLRTDRLRDNPNAAALSDLLASIRDWQAILGNTEVDPLRDFDQLLMASANPFPRRGVRPDLMAVVRSRAPRGFLRASIEQMAGARAPTARDADAGTLRSRFERDGGTVPRASENIWRRQGTAEVTTVPTYLGPTSVMLLADNLAVIAPPEQIPTLLGILGARRGVASRVGAHQPGRAGRLVTVLEAQNLRAIMHVRGAEQLVPSRVDLAMYTTHAGGTADGGAELAGALHYDNEAQANTAARLLGAALEDGHDLIDQNTRDLRVRLAAAAAGVNFANLHSALRAIRLVADGSDLRVEARLSPAEVSELLHLQRLAALF